MVESDTSNIIRRLFTQGLPETFSKGDVILGNDPEPSGVYYIASGYVKVFSIGDDGDEYIHIIYGKGEIIPLVWAYLGEITESVFYEAISEALTWRISRDWFNQFIQSHLPISYALSVQLARQFQVYSDRIDNLEYKKAGERVAYRLLYLANRFGLHVDDKIIVEVPLTHEQLARTINLARETVSRQLERLEAQHIVEQDGHRLVILDVPGLRAKISRPNNIRNWNL
jgi:CRP-like cAMP-binding protein